MKLNIILKGNLLILAAANCLSTMLGACANLKADLDKVKSGEIKETSAVEEVKEKYCM